MSAPTPAIPAEITNEVVRIQYAIFTAEIHGFTHYAKTLREMLANVLDSVKPQLSSFSPSSQEVEVVLSAVRDR